MISEYDCALKSPAGNGEQSKNICVKRKRANTTSRNYQDLSLEPSPKKKKPNCHMKPNEPKNTFLVQPYINPLNTSTKQKKKKLQHRTFGDHLTIK